MSRFLTSSFAAVAFMALMPLTVRAEHQQSDCCPQPACCQVAPSCVAAAPGAATVAPTAPAPQMAQVQPPAAPRQGTYRSYSYEPGASVPRAVPQMARRPARSSGFDPVERRQHPSNRLMGPDRPF